jgi:hypothetical protein
MHCEQGPAREAALPLPPSAPGARTRRRPGRLKRRRISIIAIIGIPLLIRHRQRQTIAEEKTKLALQVVVSNVRD